MQITGCVNTRGFYCTKHKMACWIARLKGLCSSKRTKTFEFTRQLWPPPPKDAKPWFCYIKTLIFYDKNQKEIWRQEIPECDQLGRERNKVRIYNVHVEWEKHFGWCLKFNLSHEIADELHNLILDRISQKR